MIILTNCRSASDEWLTIQSPEIRATSKANIVTKDLQLPTCDVTGEIMMETVNPTIASSDIREAVNWDTFDPENYDDEYVRETDKDSMFKLFQHDDCCHKNCLKRFGVRNVINGSQHMVISAKCGLYYCTCTGSSRLGVPCSHYWAVLMNNSSVPFHITMYNQR